VTITGTNFTTATNVDFGASPATTFTVDSDTQITAASPAETAGTIDVTVTNPGGTSATSANDQFIFEASGGGGPTQVGDCVGQVLLATPNPKLTDLTQDGVKLNGALAAVQHTTTKIGGTCTGQPRPGDTHIPAAPASLTPRAETLTLLGNATCARGPDVPLDTAANAHSWPLNGKVTWTMNETYTDPTTGLVHPYKIQAAITILGTGENGNGADVSDVGGIVLTGLVPGAIVRGSIWQDPVVKTGAVSGYNTGYELDLNAAAKCADGTANDAQISKVLIGGGGTSATSLTGSVAEGVKFETGQ
jgi:hypothetical protein